MIGTTLGYSTYLGQPDVDPEAEAKLLFSIKGAQSFVENYIGYPLELGSHTCILDGDGSNHIFVPRFPVSSITKIEHFNESDNMWVDYVVENIDVKYRIDTDTGEIKIVNNKFLKGFQNIRIQYTHGYDFSLDPLDFKLNSLIMAIYEVAALFHDNAGLLTFQSVKAGTEKSRYAFKSGTSDVQVIAMLSPEIVLIIHSFAKRGSAR